MDWKQKTRRESEDTGFRFWVSFKLKRVDSIDRELTHNFQDKGSNIEHIE
jgi:hypothetical protein